MVGNFGEISTLYEQQREGPAVCTGLQPCCSHPCRAYDLYQPLLLGRQPLCHPPMVDVSPSMGIFSLSSPKRVTLIHDVMLETECTAAHTLLLQTTVCVRTETTVSVRDRDKLYKVILRVGVRSMPELFR